MKATKTKKKELDWDGKVLGMVNRSERPIHPITGWKFQPTERIFNTSNGEMNSPEMSKFPYSG